MFGPIIAIQCMDYPVHHPISVPSVRPLSKVSKRMTITEAITPRLFRNACGRFATGVAIATTVGQDGRCAGLTVNSFSSVSLEPPLVLFSIDLSATSHDVFVNASGFAVNVLTEAQQALSNRFASMDEEDRFADVDLLDRDAGEPPLLAGCLSHFVCDLETTVPGGDHTILIGRVKRLAVSEDTALKPLLYFSGSYAQLGA